MTNFITNYFIADAFAQASDAVSQVNPSAQSNFSMASLVPLILIFVIFYFLIIRPQTKKIKEHQQMVDNLKIGNKVITSGGIIGVVRHVHDKNNQIEVEIAENVVVTIVKSSISEIEKGLDKAIEKSNKSSKKSHKNSKTN